MRFPKLHAIECRIRGWFFRRKLKQAAKFIRKHGLYPVTLDKRLLDIWESSNRQDSDL